MQPTIGTTLVREDIIDPRKTRGYLCRFIDAVQPSLRTELGPKARSGVRP